MFAPHVLAGVRDYEALRRSFRWRIPANFNIGVDVCDRWAEREAGRIALLDVRPDGVVE
jgi:acetyl-CoA synthetase